MNDTGWASDMWGVSRLSVCANNQTQGHSEETETGQQEQIYTFSDIMEDIDILKMII